MQIVCITEGADSMSKLIEPHLQSSVNMMHTVAKYKICIVCTISGYFACGEDSLRECEVDSMSKLIEPLLRSSVYMMHAVLNIKYV